MMTLQLQLAVLLLLHWTFDIHCYRSMPLHHVRDTIFLPPFLQQMTETALCLDRSKRSKSSSSPIPQKGKQQQQNLLTQTDEVATKIKYLRKTNSTKKIFNLLNQSFLESGSDLVNEKIFLLGFRSLWQMNRTDLCISLYPLYQDILYGISENTGSECSYDYTVAASLLRSYSSLGRIDMAEGIARNIGMYACMHIFIHVCICVCTTSM